MNIKSDKHGADKVNRWHLTQPLDPRIFFLFFIISKTAPPIALPTDPIEQLLQASARSQRQAVGDGWWVMGDGSSDDSTDDDSTDDWNPADYDGL